MAKPKASAVRSAIRPTTRGADVSTQQRSDARNFSKFPFKIPKPKPNGAAVDERSLYSQSELAPGGSRQQRSAAAVSAAQARMRGSVPIEPLDDEDEEPELDLDELGESDGAALAPDSATFDELRARFDQEVEKAVQSKLAEIQQSRALPLGQTPTPTPTPAARPAAHLAIRRVAPEDVDRLWDWIRREPATAAGFLGLVPSNAKQLYAVIESFMRAEDLGVGLVRSLYMETPQGEQHLGFGLLAPIMGDEKIAVLHVYLEQSIRGRLPQLIAALIQLGEGLAPGHKLAVVPADQGQARLYGQLLQPLGFTSHVIFVR